MIEQEKEKRGREKVETKEYIKNDIIHLYHQFFKLAYYGLLSAQAYRLGDLLYWYISDLTSKDTEIVDHYFIYSIRKLDLARDLGYSDESALRKKNKSRNGLTVWQELENVGFIFGNGRRNKKAKQGRRTTIYIPLSIIGKVNMDQMVFPSHFMSRKERTLEMLKYLIVKINGLYEENQNQKWYELDYHKFEMEWFKIFNFQTSSIAKIEANLFRQFCWVLARNHIPFGDNDLERHKLYKNFKQILNDTADRNFVVLQRVLYKVGSKNIQRKGRLGLKDLNGVIRYEIKLELDQYRKWSHGGVTKEALQEMVEENNKWEQFFERYYHRQVKHLNKKLKNSTNPLQVVQNEMDNYFSNSALINDNDGRWYDYLMHRKRRLIEQQLEKQRAEEILQEQTLKEATFNELLCSNETDDYEYLL